MTVSPNLDLRLTLNSVISGNIEISEFNVNPETSLNGIEKALGKYVVIEVSQNVKDNLNNSVITARYTDAEINNLNLEETSLKFYFFNEGLEKWEVIPSSVDTVNNIITGTTTHFSTFGVGGQEKVTSPVTPSSNSESSSGRAIYDISQSQIINGISRTLERNDQIKFSLNSESYYLALDFISDDAVSITIDNGIGNFDLELGEVKKIELTDDNFYDLVVELESVSGNRASLRLQSIHDEISKETENGEIDRIEITGKIVGDFFSSGAGFGLIIGLLILAGGVVVILKNKGLRKNQNKKSGK